MRRPTLALLAALAALAAAPALAADPTPAPAGRTPAPKGAYCYIGWPNDGETVGARSRSGSACAAWA